MRTLILGLAAVLLPMPASADEVFLKGGGRVSGRIVTRTATLIEVDVGAGVIGVSPASVLRIEEGRSPLHDYEDRASRLGPGDVEGWLALGDWARGAGLGAQATAAYNRALSAAPGDPRAHTALGHVNMDGRWLSEDEGYRAKGFVKYDGEWITPAEHEAILRERAAEAEEDRRRREAESAAREAEARAQEAEARAKKEAEAAEEAAEGLPLWYGWGAGPTVWPAGPVVSRPIRGRR